MNTCVFSLLILYNVSIPGTESLANYTIWVKSRIAEEKLQTVLSSTRIIPNDNLNLCILTDSVEIFGMFCHRLCVRKCLSDFAHFNCIIWYLILIFRVFFLNSEYKFFARYKLYNYFIPVSGLYFHLLNNSLYKSRKLLFCSSNYQLFC